MLPTTNKMAWRDSVSLITHADVHVSDIYIKPGIEDNNANTHMEPLTFHMPKRGIRGVSLTIKVVQRYKALIHIVCVTNLEFVWSMVT